MVEEIEMLQSCSNNQPKRRKIDTEDNPSTTIPPSIRNSKKPRVSFLLDKAPLKMGTVHKTSKILNVDEHSQILLKQKKNLEDYNPAILHRSLLAIIDSPLTKSGMVQSIYVKVDNGVLFEVKSHTRIPRMYKRFYGLMVELLKKSRITSNNENEKLLRVIQEPVTKYLPPNSRIIGLSHGSEKLVKIEDYVASIDDDINLVFVVGLMADGEIDKTFIDDFISVSKYPLSSSVTIGGFVCDALQDLWNII